MKTRLPEGDEIWKLKPGTMVVHITVAKGLGSVGEEPCCIPGEAGVFWVRGDDEASWYKIADLLIVFKPETDQCPSPTENPSPDPSPSPVRE